MRYSCVMRRCLAMVAALVALPAAARPIAVHVNNVRVDGMKGQTFSDAEVRFDESGDIYITAKGYKVSAVEANPPQAAAAPPAAHRFYIATVQPRPGATQWDIEVYINKVYVKRFRSRDPEPVTEITRYLHPGENVVHFQARKE